MYAGMPTTAGGIPGQPFPGSHPPSGGTNPHHGSSRGGRGGHRGGRGRGGGGMGGGGDPSTTQCKYATFSGGCKRVDCKFFHPPGTHNPQPMGGAPNHGAGPATGVFPGHQPMPAGMVGMPPSGMHTPH